MRRGGRILNRVAHEDEHELSCPHCHPEEATAAAPAEAGAAGLRHFWEHSPREGIVEATQDDEELATTVSCPHCDHLAPGGNQEQLVADFRRRFMVALILSVPIFIVAPWAHLGMQTHGVSFPGSNVVLLLLSAALYGYCGKPFLVGALGEVRARQPGMMT
ncbi:MAG: hypothetical protein N2512_11010, partial [Armatimonadetes bacterium]|nr:hypothetical protein [Armatimonadota bacterium]